MSDPPKVIGGRDVYRDLLADLDRARTVTDDICARLARGSLPADSEVPVRRFCEAGVAADRLPTEDGDWWNPPAVSLAFRRAVRALPVPRIRFHDLRHSHASLLLRAGVNPKVVSERLGHSSVAFTLDTYAHVMPGMQPEAAQLFSDLVFDDRDDPDEDEEQAS